MFLTIAVSIGLVLLALAAPGGTGGSASAAGTGLEMILVITEGGVCNGDDCYADLGSSFKLGVELRNPPADGYFAMQTFLNYGDYDPTASEDGAGPNTCGDGIENGGEDDRDSRDNDCTSGPFTYEAAAISGEVVWPDSALEIHFAGAGWLYNGGITGLLPPLSQSNHVGLVVEVQFRCPATAISGDITLLPYLDPFAYTLGSALKTDYHTVVQPKLDTITMHCGMQAEPGDSDGDGCSDVAESGSDPSLGGDRDWLNPRDFYDVTGDKHIDLFNDVVGVLNHQGPAPGPPYDVQYDRGPWTGANSWNGTRPADGTIDLFNDIRGVIAQYGHDCR